MNDLLPPCDVWPNLMIAGAAGIGCYIFVNSIRVGAEPIPPWHWGAKPRRPHKRAQRALISQIVGALLAAFAISYALNNPICG